MQHVLFDMETADPDDVFTLCFLTSHPDVNLCAVTITPGSDDQVGLVKRVLALTNHSEVPVGANRYPKSCVSSFHHKYLEWQPVKPDASAPDLINNTAKTYYEDGLVLLTGAPLKNIHKFLENNPFFISRWVAQGGFAGDNIVPPEHRLEKFAGRKTCPTFNFNGDVEGAKLALSSTYIKQRYLVSKNVCHGVNYDKDVHEFVALHKDKTPGLSLMYKGMDEYLKKRSAGKLFHDPLAAAVLVDPTVCSFEEVELYRRKGEWGSIKKEDSNTFISTSYNRQKFLDILVKTKKS